MIAEKKNKDDQNFHDNLLRSLYQAAKSFNDKEFTESEDPCKIEIPQLPLEIEERQMTPFKTMEKNQLLQLQETMMDLLDFQSIIKS